MSNDATIPTTDYWASFIVMFDDKPGLGFELHSPWWISGETEDGSIIVCALRANDEDHAAAIIESAMDEGSQWAPRFLDELERKEVWTDRFPQSSWMAWDETSTCACGLDTCNGNDRMKIAPDIPMGRGTRAEELKLLCSLFMSDDHGDDSVLTKGGEGSEDEVIRDFLNAQARAHGYDSWVFAYHEIGKR